MFGSSCDASRLRDLPTRVGCQPVLSRSPTRVGCQPEAMAIPRPIVGDILMFRNPPPSTFAHYIYSGFPRGRRLSRRQCFMDFGEFVEVLEVQDAWIRWEWFVAIKFRAPDGQHVWTNYPKGYQAYMLKIEVDP